eukprot:scaffold64749_cov28-Tisochrysis_lutea.AAC.11
MLSEVEAAEYPKRARRGAPWGEGRLGCNLLPAGRKAACRLARSHCFRAPARERNQHDGCQRPPPLGYTASPTAGRLVRLSRYSVRGTGDGRSVAQHSEFAAASPHRRERAVPSVGGQRQALEQSRGCPPTWRARLAGVPPAVRIRAATA